MSQGQTARDARPAALDRTKFDHPDITAAGAPRAYVDFRAFETLWFNTGTLCNLACDNCYIESSPTNDRLVYLSASEVAGFLDEADGLRPRPREIAFTGGEPFMNPDIIAMIEDSLQRGYDVLVLTNGMRPLLRHRDAVRDLTARFGRRLALRVSVDHYSQALHEMERGAGSWAPMIEGLTWLSQIGANLSVAGRTCWQEGIPALRRGYGRLFAGLGIDLDENDPARLHLLPEMDAGLDVPEITEACWGILGVDPDDMMCASSRMVVKRKGAEAATVVPCTLLPYEPEFEMGGSLAGATEAVKLNHPHCARFCVLGGGACSVRADEDGPA